MTERATEVAAVHLSFERNTGNRIQESEFGTENESFAARYFEDLNLRRRFRWPELLNSVFCFLFSESRPFKTCIFRTKNKINQMLDSERGAPYDASSLGNNT
jgi:hypothetical protein